jgi:hypothetical protein
MQSNRASSDARSKTSSENLLDTQTSQRCSGDRVSLAVDTNGSCPDGLPPLGIAESSLFDAIVLLFDL